MKQGFGQVVLLAGPASSATTQRTASLDTAVYGGVDAITFVTHVNAEANTDSTNVIMQVLHSDDTVVTNHVSLGTHTVDNTAAAGGIVHVNWNGKKRYARVVITPDTTTNGAIIYGGLSAHLNPAFRGLTDSTTCTVLRIA